MQRRAAVLGDSLMLSRRILTGVVSKRASRKSQKHRGVCHGSSRGCWRKGCRDRREGYQSPGNAVRKTRASCMRATNRAKVCRLHLFWKICRQRSMKPSDQQQLASSNETVLETAALRKTQRGFRAPRTGTRVIYELKLGPDLQQVLSLSRASSIDNIHAVQTATKESSSASERRPQVRTPVHTCKVVREGGVRYVIEPGRRVDPAAVAGGVAVEEARRGDSGRTSNGFILAAGHKRHGT